MVEKSTKSLDCKRAIYLLIFNEISYTLQGV
jgi:hypothetical protein